MGLLDYAPIGKERKQSIDAIVADLRQKYLDRNGKWDFDSLCTDNSIKYYEHWSVTYPCASVADRLIFNVPSKNEKGNEVIKLHELGHILLGHLYLFQIGTENEAWYFARKMLGLNRLTMFSIVTRHILDQAMLAQHRMSTYQDKGNSWDAYKWRLLELSKGLDPIHPKPTRGPWSQS